MQVLKNESLRSCVRVEAMKQLRGAKENQSDRSLRSSKGGDGTRLGSSRGSVG